MRFRLVRWFSLFFSGLVAGTFFYGTFTVLPAFYDVSPEIHLGFRTALMNHNRLIVMALVLVTIASTTVYLWEVRKIKVVRMLCLSALLLTIFSLVITRFGSVPINMLIKTWDTVSPPANWLTILERWDLYNAFRTAASLGSFACLLLMDIIREKTPAG